MENRLKWVREKERYAAYPVGSLNRDRVACICQNARKPSTWIWTVKWPGWFSDSGPAENKQGAADAATAAWWKYVATPIPRDVDLEVDILRARVLIMPPPNNLFSEDSDFLRNLIAGLALQYQAEMKDGTVPDSVAKLIERLSEELFRRRLAEDAEASCSAERSWWAAHR